MSISRRQFIAGVGATALSVSSLGFAGCANNASSGTKIIYGSIYAGFGAELAEALVIKDGRVDYCGTAEGAKKYASGDAEVTTLAAEQLIIPGLIDAHCHPWLAWNNQLNAVSFGEGDKLEDYKSKLADHIKRNPEKTSYRATGWFDNRFEGSLPTASILDEVCSDKPVFATDAGGHGMWCNTKAMDLFFADHPELKFIDRERAGTDIESINGGTIERDSDGKAVGCFRDTAVVYLQRILPVATKEDYIPCLKSAVEEYVSLGCTAFVEATINERTDLTKTPILEAYQQLEEEGNLPLYVDGAFIVGNRDDSFELVKQAIALRDQTRDGRVRVTDIKIFMDGVVEGGSAWLQEEYADQPGYYGSATWGTEDDLAKLTKIIEMANEVGMAVHFHAIGDRASVEALNCIAKAAESIGIEKVRETRNVITHLQIVDDSSYAKFLEYNVVANLSPWGVKSPGFYEETEVVKLGRERAESEYPIKTFLNKGVHCSFGSDYGSSFTYKFNECYHALTTRTDATLDQLTCLNPKERISPEEALRLMTAGGAYQIHRENDLGTLEAGKVANLVVLDINLFESSDDDTIKTNTLRTMVDGVWLN